jgi:hypothetical protein
MAIVKTEEGQVNTVNPVDTLEYPSINSCLSITTVLPQITRLSGHAVLIPEEEQFNLQAICNYIQTRPYADQLYIIGDIGTWNENWTNLPQCKDLHINGQQIVNVEGIATALGYENAVIFDTNNWGNATFDIYFGFENNARSLWGKNRATQERVYIPVHRAW